MGKRPLVDPPPEPTPQRSNSQQIVDAIIAAALELGAEATLADIAERAGVGSASVHRYFPTLSSIFAEVSRRMFRMLLGQIKITLADRERALREIVRDVCRTAFAGSNVSLEYRRRMNLEIPLAWSHLASAVAYKEILDEVTGWLEANLVAPPPDLAGRVFAAFACVRGTVSMWLLYPADSPALEAMIDHSTDAAMAVLLSGGSAALRPVSETPRSDAPG
jgi:AcrR family transcriptional regulator